MVVGAGPDGAFVTTACANGVHQLLSCLVAVVEVLVLWVEATKGARMGREVRLRMAVVVVAAWEWRRVEVEKLRAQDRVMMMMMVVEKKAAAALEDIKPK